MPLDQAGGAAPPPPPSSWQLRLDHLKLFRRVRKREDRKRRRVTQQHLAMAEMILGSIVDGGDVIAEVTIERALNLNGSSTWSEPAVCLLVTLGRGRFCQLLEYGADLEDDEEEHEINHDEDDEPPVDDEPSLVPAADGQFGFGTFDFPVKHDDDREQGLAAPEKVEAAHQRIKTAGGVSEAEIRTGAGKLVGRTVPWRKVQIIGGLRS